MCRYRDPDRKLVISSVPVRPSTPSASHKMYHSHVTVVVVLLSVLTKARSQALLGLDEGDICKRAADSPWTCTTLKKCSHIDVRILRPSICSFRGRDPIICCPPKKMSKSEMNCKWYTKKSCPYQDKIVWQTKPPIENHVIGGKPVKPGSRKYMVRSGSLERGSFLVEVKMHFQRNGCLNYTPLCNKVIMFRHSDDSKKSPNALDWADFGEDAVAIDVDVPKETIEMAVNAGTSGSTTERAEIPLTTAVPQQSSTIPEQSSAVPEQSSAIPEQSSAIPEQSSSIPEQSSPIPEQSSPIPEQSSPIPEHSSTERPENTSTTSEIAPTDATFNTTGPPQQKPRQFVVGGHLSLPRIHRHMVAVGYGRADAISWNCGGSLVSDLWVLSAAHCTSTPDLGEAKWARLGELDLASTSEDARPQDRRIVRRVNHPQYRPPAAYHDIALYKLDSPVVFNQYVAPVCLHNTFDIGEKKATVVGWGSTEFAGSTSSKLMEVDVTLVDHVQCRQAYGSDDQQAPNGINRLAMVCAGEKEGGKDACTGDSGGPLAINQPGTCLKKQVGITSFGRDCGLPNTPGVYTRVSTYVPWIESIVWP